METAEPLVVDLDGMVEVADRGIVSKAIVENAHHKIVHFTLAQGQELSEHTASVPAVIHVLGGQGKSCSTARRTRRAPASCTTCRPICATP